MQNNLLFLAPIRAKYKKKYVQYNVKKKAKTKTTTIFNLRRKIRAIRGFHFVIYINK